MATLAEHQQYDQVRFVRHSKTGDNLGGFIATKASKCMAMLDKMWLEAIRGEKSSYLSFKLGDADFEIRNLQSLKLGLEIEDGNVIILYEEMEVPSPTKEDDEMPPDVPLKPSPAIAWIETHCDEWRGQWVAVRLDQPALVAIAPTLTQLLRAASQTELQACLVHYIHTLEEEAQAQGPEWQG